MEAGRRNLLVGAAGAATAAVAARVLRDDDPPAPVRPSSSAPFDVPASDVTRYGAVGDGATDDTDAIEAAIRASLGEADSLRGGRIFFPKGVYRITRTVVLDRAAAVVEGVGWGATRPTSPDARGSVLLWDGADDVPMLRLENCMGTSVRDLLFAASTTARPSAAVSLRSVGSHLRGCSFNSLSSLWIGPLELEGGAGAPPSFARGIALEGDDVAAGSNRFEMITIVGCRTGVHVTRPKFVRNAFFGLRIAQCDTAFESDAAISTSGTNWVLSGSARADIALGTGARLRVHGFRSQMSARLALTESSSLMMRDGVWEMGPAMAPDGVVIDGRKGSGRAFLRLDDVDFSDDGAKVPGRILWEPRSQVFLSNFAGPTVGQ